MSAVTSPPTPRVLVARPLDTVLGLLLGVVFTAVLFGGIAHLQHLPSAAPAPEIVELRQAAALPEPPPPPPPVQPVEVTAPPLPIAGLEYSPSDSPVTIAVSPPDFSLEPPPVSAAPAARLEVASPPARFKPSMDLGELDRVYQTSEIDRALKVVQRKVSPIPRRVRDEAQSLSCTFVLVVDAQGVPGNIRVLRSSGNPDFDQLVGEDMKEWIFTPATRKGRPVRCLIQQRVTVQWSKNSVFSL